MNEFETIADCIAGGFKHLIGKKWTASPAEVIKFNKSTRRVSVRIIPAIPTSFTDHKDYPVLSDVPVVFPSGGGFSFFAPIKKGDTLLLVFCRRGISNFKQDFKNNIPSGGVMDINSAVAIPCFGNIEVTLPEEYGDGAIIQKDDGTVSLEVTDSSVISRTEGGTTELKADGNLYVAKKIFCEDVMIGITQTPVSIHKHSGVTRGTGATDGMTL